MNGHTWCCTPPGADPESYNEQLSEKFLIDNKLMKYVFVDDSDGTYCYHPTLKALWIFFLYKKELHEKFYTPEYASINFNGI